MVQPIYTGSWGNCHIQGITVDPQKGYVYFSYTTKLVKAKLDGTIVGCVDGLVGHLGCIDFCEADGRVYGSLEFKHDVIGTGILDVLGSDAKFEDGWYVAIFDVDKIDRLDMDAEKDGVVTCVYLPEILEDYAATGKNKQGESVPHRFGCGGIDGTGFGPIPGDPDGKEYLFLAYGIYSDTTRDDNDYQILLCYDTSDWKKYEKPLSQSNMHKIGPTSPEHKFFVYTGNTEFGVQNLEYDRNQQAYFLAVYPGHKEEFPNYKLFAVDATIAPKKTTLPYWDEEVEVLTLKPIGLHDEATDTWGWHYPHGSTGMYSFGNGDWLFSENRICESGQCSYLFYYTWNGTGPFITKG